MTDPRSPSPSPPDSTHLAIADDRLESPRLRERLRQSRRRRSEAKVHLPGERHTSLGAEEELPEHKEATKRNRSQTVRDQSTLDQNSHHHRDRLREPPTPPAPGKRHPLYNALGYPLPRPTGSQPSEETSIKKKKTHQRVQLRCDSSRTQPTSPRTPSLERDPSLAIGVILTLGNQSDLRVWEGIRRASLQERPVLRDGDREMAGPRGSEALRGTRAGCPAARLV